MRTTVEKNEFDSIANHIANEHILRRAHGLCAFTSIHTLFVSRSNQNSKTVFVFLFFFGVLSFIVRSPRFDLSRSRTFLFVFFISTFFFFFLSWLTFSSYSSDLHIVSFYFFHSIVSYLIQWSSERAHECTQCNRQSRCWSFFVRLNSYGSSKSLASTAVFIFVRFFLRRCNGSRSSCE